MTNRLAHALSIVFQPLFVPFYTVLLVLNAHSYIAFAVQGTLRHVLLAIVAINTMVLPMMVFAWFLRKGMISSLHMRERNERHLPFLVSITFLLSTYMLIGHLPLPSLFRWLVISSVVSIVLAFVINLFWKVSIHMLGMGGMLGAVIALGLLFQVDVMAMSLTVVLLSGAVGWSRLTLDAHTPAQVYAGFVLGLVTAVGVLVV